MKIGLTGTQSCGKSTLVQSLSLLPEFKDYKIFTEKSKEIMKEGIKLNTDSTFIGQTYFMGHRAIELNNNNILTDRTIIDVIAYTLNAQSIEKQDKIDFEKYSSKLILEYDWIFYISPAGVQIENNGVRETDAEYRELIDQTIKYLCSAHLDKIKNFGIISGSNDDRIKQIKSYLNL
jgi:GTPase SAR1 family protein